MMKEAIEQRGGDDRIAEHLAPFCKATIGGQDPGPALVARVDELEEQVAAPLNDRQVAEVAPGFCLIPRVPRRALRYRGAAARHPHCFLAFWEAKLEGPLFAVTVAHSKLLKPAELRTVDGVFRLH
jgi:hypothetical protein